MKFKFITMVLGALLMIPGFVSAAGTAVTPDSGQTGKGPCNCGDERQHHGMRDWHAKVAQKEQELLGWVNTYTPEKKAEWTKVLAESRTLHEKWHSPEFAKQREQVKKEKMAQFQELKKQYNAGKITKEEFFGKVHGGQKFAYWKNYHDLKAAVKANDRAKAAENLNSLLASLKEHNKMMQAKMK